jgi:hypothetical protein
MNTSSNPNLNPNKWQKNSKEWKPNTNLSCNSNGWNKKLMLQDPASQYIRQQIIQKTVRVPGSLYTHDLGALTSYQQPIATFANVDWNQMSDRAVPHVQPKLVVGGSFYHGSSTKRTITRARPGAGCPGGTGVDIKHNSYDRYLNRLKGKGPLRRGVIPPTYGAPIIYNPALPIRGGKTIKTNIVGSNCGCPIGQNDLSKINSILVNPVLLFNGFVFSVGNVVYALDSGNMYSRAVIISGGTPTNGSSNNTVVVRFDDGTVSTTTTDTLRIYYPCDGCNVTIPSNNTTNINRNLPPSVSACFTADRFLGSSGVFNLISYLQFLFPLQYQNLSYDYKKFSPDVDGDGGSGESAPFDLPYDDAF